jgi:hypothetical protein
MSARPLTDEQLTLALRTYLPAKAPGGSADRLVDAITETPQLRPLPFVVAALGDADPIGRRRSLLLAAAVLALAALLGGLAVGAWRLIPDTQTHLSLEPPADVQAYAVSVLQDSPVVRPMAMTVTADRAPSPSRGGTDGPVKARVMMDRAGNVRIEHFATIVATEPDTYKIVTADRLVELGRQGNEPVWIEEPFDGDPRGWVVHELAAYIGVSDDGVSDCEMTRLDPSSGWRYIGLETVLGRPAHHIFCGGEFWIDTETRLILRSHGPLTADGRPANDTTRTIEVTALDLAEQPARLFTVAKPSGIRVVSRDAQRVYEERLDEDVACAADPVCSADEMPVVKLPPARDPEPQSDAGAIVAAARAARNDVAAVQMTVERWRSRGGVIGDDRLFYQGPDRFRVERSEDELAGIPAHTSIWAGDSGVWDLRTDAQDRTYWLRFTNGRNIGDAQYMWLEGILFSLPECGPPGGLPPTVAGPHWRHLGVDQVGDFTADHITCGDAGLTWTIDGNEYGCGCAGMEFWIDRATHLVVRRLVPAEGLDPLRVDEVVDLAFRKSPEDLFHPPDDAVIEAQPTPDPGALASPPPQPASTS